MAFALLTLRGHRIAKQKRRLENEKLQNKNIQVGIGTRWRRFVLDFRRFFRNLCTFSCVKKNTRIYHFVQKLKLDGTFENYIMKSIVGFISGFVLIYIFFIFFVIIMSMNLATASILCSIFGCTLTIGLAFSSTVRCIVLLILPQFFSKRGRQALLAYAFILVITGPSKNMLNNMGIMSESLACGQEQLKQAIKQILDVIKKPFIAIKEALKKVVEVVKEIVKKIKEIFMTIKRIVMNIVYVIKSAFQFLAKIFNICSKKIGTPFERCMRVFDQAILDCQAKLGPLFSWLCSLTYVIQAVCYIVKPLDFICMLIEFISTSFIGVIVRKIKKFIRHIRATFYVRIRFSHSFHFETQQTKTMREVAEDIIREIKERTAVLNKAFNMVAAATSMFFLVVILKAIQYRYKFLTSERFDNFYITNEFREIDFRRAQMEKETVLPLNRRERLKYVDSISIRLVAKEKKELSKSLSVLASATIKFALFMFGDYALYWVLSMIRFYGKYKNTIEAPRTVGIHVSGNGFLAELFRAIAFAFNPLGFKMDVDTVPCLPDPIQPDYDKYVQIGVITGLCWIFAILEPYGLRSRNAVARSYYPGRARERAIWLYNHILRTRSTFLKFARRQLRRKFFKDDTITKITCKEYLRAHVPFASLRWCIGLGSDKQESCLLCAEVFRPDGEAPIKCATPGCVGIYCQQCFADLRNICTICLDPIQYGDLSDIDEEIDSSEDETSNKFKRRQEKLRAGEDTQIPLLDDDIDISSNCSEDSGNSTDYSTSYQYNKNCKATSITQIPFQDVENQKEPDYVSMSIFCDYFFCNNPRQTSYENYDEETSNKTKSLSNSKSTENSSDNEATPFIKHNVQKSVSSNSTFKHVQNWLEKKSMFSKKHHCEEIIPLLEMKYTNSEQSSSSSTTNLIQCIHDAEYEMDTNSVQSSIKLLQKKILPSFGASNSSETDKNEDINDFEENVVESQKEILSNYNTNNNTSFETIYNNNVFEEYLIQSAANISQIDILQIHDANKSDEKNIIDDANSIQSSIRLSPSEILPIYNTNDIQSVSKILQSCNSTDKEENKDISSEAYETANISLIDILPNVSSQTHKDEKINISESTELASFRISQLEDLPVFNTNDFSSQTEDIHNSSSTSHLAEFRLNYLFPNVKYNEINENESSSEENSN